MGELVICEVNRKKENSVYRIERTLPHQVRDDCVSKSWAKILEIAAVHHYRQTHLDSGEARIYILILLESLSVIFLQLMIRNKYFVMLRLTQVFFCARSFMLKTRPERREQPLLLWGHYNPLISQMEACQYLFFHNRWLFMLTSSLHTSKCSRFTIPTSSLYGLKVCNSECNGRLNSSFELQFV